MYNVSVRVMYRLHESVTSVRFTCLFSESILSVLQRVQLAHRLHVYLVPGMS